MDKYSKRFTWILNILAIFAVIAWVFDASYNGRREAGGMTFSTSFPGFWHNIIVNGYWVFFAILIFLTLVIGYITIMMSIDWIKDIFGKKEISQEAIDSRVKRIEEKLDKLLESKRIKS